MIGKFFKFVVIGFLALLGIGVAFTLVAGAIGLLFLAVKLAIVGGIGYGVYKLVSGTSKPKAPEISEADRKWLNS